MRTWVCFGESGGPPGGSGAPGWQNPGTRNLLVRVGPALPCPALPCPETRKVALLALLSSNPNRVRKANCLLGTLAFCRAAGTGREGKKKSKKAPLEGGLGGEP